MIFVGIDPGKHGAVAWMDGERKHIEVCDCPLDAGDYHFKSMSDLIVAAFDVASEECPISCDGKVTIRHSPIVTMELVHSMPHDGKASAFSFGLGYGAWLGILGSLAIAPQLICPQTWKRTMLAGIANDKAAEAQACKQIFQGHEIASKLHGPRGGIRDGRVDALLLAEYGRRCFKLSPRRAA